MTNSKKIMLLSATTLLFGLVGCGGGSDSTNWDYTYNTYLSSSPSKWSSHTWETSDESYIPGFCEMGLYDCILNDSKDGYEFVSEMASEMPVAIDPEDITDDEMDTYYAKTGNIDKNMVWDIKLNQAAVWEDGSAITATDYVDSMERLLSPKYANYRASSYYDGNMVLVNAENYYKQGRQTIESFYKYYDSSEGDVPDSTGFYFLNLGIYSEYVNSVFSNADSSTTLYNVLNQFSTTSGYNIHTECERIIAAYSYYLWKSSDHASSSNKTTWDSVKSPKDVTSTLITDDAVYLDIDVFDEGFTNADGQKDTIKTLIDVDGDWETGNIEEYSTEDLKDDLQACVAAIGLSRGDTGKSWSWKLPLFTYVITYDGEEIEFSDVGIKKIDDYTFRIYLTKSITALNLKFALTSNWLVNVSLYDKLTQDLGTGSWATTYGANSVDNYMSYGPYKLTYFEADKEIKMERNDKWYGYSDGKHEGQFKMECIDTMIYSKHETALSEFFAGNLDDIDLTVTEYRTYGMSGRCTTTYESYTQKISFNSDRDKLESRQSGTENKTVLANMNFRKGLSLSMDRKSFASQATSGSKGFTALLNDLYLAENATGTSYRSTKQGQSVYNAIYGHLGGETIDEENGEALSESAYGYNEALAAQYVALGLKEELKSDETGHIKAGDTITIEFRVYDDESENTVAAINFIQTTWSGIISKAVEILQAAEVLTSDETIGFKLNIVKDQDYYTTARNGGFDMIFSIWGGAAVNPYGLMEVYCKNDFTNCCEYGFKGKQATTYIGIDADGDGSINENTEYKSFDTWYSAMTDGDEYNEAKYGDDLEEGDENYEAYLEVHNKKLNVLAGLEAGIVNRFEAVPLVARGSSSLLGFKVDYATDKYVSLVGYGGVRFLEFNYTNAEWSNFCANNNNDLRDLYKAAE